MSFLYQCHESNGYYTCEDMLDYEELYCETCGDSDWQVGEYETERELFDLLMEEFETFEEDVSLGTLKYIVFDFFPDIQVSESDSLDREVLLKKINAYLENKN